MTKSPYSNTQVVGRFMMHYVHQKIAPHPGDDVKRVVRDWVRRPDLMALDLYGDPDLWFVFGSRNALEDPVYDLVLDRELIVPPLSHVLKSIR